MTWMPIWAMPNIDLDGPVESSFFALVPCDDRRVRRMKRQHPEFRKFMVRFTDTFKSRINPTLIIRRADAPERLQTSEAAAGFRDLLVASMVPYVLSRCIIYDNPHNRVGYSSYFWIYPWMIDRNYKHIIAHTPAILALHKAQAFKGQSSPDLSPTRVNRGDFDEPLLQELLQRWMARYNVDDPAWADIALFRSLNVANQALLVPAGPDTTIHDLGRIAGLWVASFEILVHPGGNGRANLEKVFDLLERVPWIATRCGHRRFETGTRNRSVRRNLACWIYKKLSSCRNDFLHGNPVANSSLMIPQSGRSLLSIAPSLYRLGLTSFLDLSWKEQPPPVADAEAFARYYAEESNFKTPQHTAEKALLLARVSQEEQRRRRQELIRAARERRR